MKKRDPAQGRCDISGDSAKVWVNASALAIGVAPEVNGSIIEDAAWQCPHDTCHINMAELDAVIMGLNLALTWQMKKIELITDLATVHRWISDGLSGRTRLKTKAPSEMLIRRRVGLVLSLSR
uniref:RNase H domain-containing protein n=1 Tax=Trichuris muris TaxID=70415 RepID=A0A5S6QB38_TRIMR